MSQLQALLNGVDHLEPVDLSRWGGPAETIVRPLSSVEAGRLETIRLGDLRSQVRVAGELVESDPVIEDLGSFLQKQREANVFAVACGLSHSGDTCTVEQAGELPVTWVDALSGVVLRISGLEPQDDSFRVVQGVDGAGEDSGSGDASAEPERDAAGIQPAGADTSSA